MIKEIINKIFAKNFYSELNLKQKIVFAVFFILSLPLNLIRKPTPGMEGSWEIGLNMALHKKLTWGSDFVFTYGPLGFLQTRVAEYVTKIPIIIFTVFVWLNILFIFLYFLRSCNLKYKFDFFIAIVIAFMFYQIVKIEVSTTLIYIILFHLIYSLKNKNYFSLINAAFTGVVCVFIKLTYFFPLIIIFGTYFLFVLFKTKLSRNIVLGIIIFQMIVITILSFILNVNIPQYILAGYHIVSAYNEAMMILPSREAIFTPVLKYILPGYNDESLSLVILISTFLISCPLLFITGKNLIKNRTNLFSVLVTLYCLFFLFLTFKYGFVRHGGLTYLYPPVILFLLALLKCFGNVSIHGMRLYVYFVCIILFIPSVVLFNRGVMQRDTFAYYSIVINLKNAVRHLTGSKVQRLETKPSNRKKEFLPDRVLSKINNKTVDIIPTEIAIAFFNKLNYNPRPIIQSYSAYDSYLDNKNFEFFNSKKAPQFIIYNIATIDDRYHFFDEPKTKFNLAKSYMVVDSFNNRLLLEKRKSDRKVTVVDQENKKIHLNEVIDIKNCIAYQLTSFRIQYTKMGALVSFLYQPPIIRLTFYLSNDSTVTCRFIKPAVENPVLINKYIPNNKAFAGLLNLSDSFLLYVKKIKIVAPEWAYKNEVEVKSKWVILKEKL